jgi:hypothetical protein
MTGTFYRLLADPALPKRWFLGTPVDPEGEDLDPRIFTEAVPFEGRGGLVLPLARKGKEVDFNFAAFDVVVTPRKLNLELAELLRDKLQAIPVQVESSGQTWEILNVLDQVKCIDDSRSEFMIWTQADGRPDKVGAYRMITRLRIRPDAASGHDFFRVEEWPIALVASERVRRIFMSHGITGVVFDPIS